MDTQNEKDVSRLAILTPLMFYVEDFYGSLSNFKFRQSGMIFNF